MRTISLFFVVLLGIGIPAAQAQPQEAAQWQKVAESIPLGSKVKVKLIDGQHVNGVLMQVDASLMVKKGSGKPAVTIDFDRVERLERDPGGMTFPKAIAIAAATGAGIMTTLFVILMQID